jgi:hypothetical protein
VIIDMLLIKLRIALEQIQNILHAELANSLSTLNSGLRKLAFSFLQFKDTFFD